MRKLLIALILILVPAVAPAKHLHPEKWYRENWCSEHGGQVDVRLPDGTRCDCLTETHSIEFDFAKKRAEAVGQALYYGIQTGNKPGIVLILEKETDRSILFG